MRRREQVLVLGVCRFNPTSPQPRSTLGNVFAAILLDCWKSTYNIFFSTWIQFLIFTQETLFATVHSLQKTWWNTVLTIFLVSSISMERNQAPRWIFVRHLFVPYMSSIVIKNLKKWQDILIWDISTHNTCKIKFDFYMLW